MGLKPNATFVIEHDGKGQGGMTHTYIHYKYGGKEYWFENAWGGREGIHVFNNADEIKKEIEMAHRTGEYGNNKIYSELDFQDFDWTKQIPGEDLQEYVDRCYKYWK